MTMEILKVQDLCKTYGKGEAKVEALKKVSFSLDKGEFAAVVGESGSGKSTLLNCIGALDTPTSGHIWIDEQDLFSMKEEQRTIFRRRNIGFIFQSFQLVSELNVEQNIMFPLLLDYRKPDPGRQSALPLSAGVSPGVWLPTAVVRERAPPLPPPGGILPGSGAPAPRKTDPFPATTAQGSPWPWRYWTGTAPTCGGAP